MELKFKQPLGETKKIMSKVAIGKTPLADKDISFKDIAEYKILDLTHHNHCQLVNSGNGAIFIAISSITGTLLIPDMGAWHGFKQIAKFLNIPFINIKTNLGLIDLKSLKDTIKNLNNEKRNGLILTSFAAYTAEQNISELNVQDGGFISTNDQSIFTENKILINSFKSNEITASGIATELSYASQNLENLIKATSYIKSNLDNVVHSDKRGINIILKSDNKDLAYNLKKELQLDKHSMITKCPNYNRLKIKGVAIEIKNLDYSELNKENLDNIIEIISKYQ